MRYLTALLLAFATPLWADFEAEDQTPSGKFTTAGEVKQILEVTKGNWIAVREYDGQDWLYVTQLASWRCGLHQIKVGVNGAEPEVWPLPECQEGTATPNAIPNEDVLMVSKTYELGSVERVEVDILLDDMSTMSAVFDRAGVQIQ